MQWTGGTKDIKFLNPFLISTGIILYAAYYLYFWSETAFRRVEYLTGQFGIININS